MSTLQNLDALELYPVVVPFKLKEELAGSKNPEIIPENIVDYPTNVDVQKQEKGFKSAL